MKRGQDRKWGGGIQSNSNHWIIFYYFCPYFWLNDNIVHELKINKKNNLTNHCCLFLIRYNPWTCWSWYPACRAEMNWWRIERICFSSSSPCHEHIVIRPGPWAYSSTPILDPEHIHPHPSWTLSIFINTHPGHWAYSSNPILDPE